MRTHVDQTAENFYSNSEPRKVTEAKVVDKIRQDIRRQLRQLKLEEPENIPIFVVSNRNTSKFELPRLMEEIAQNLPQAKARQFLVSVMSFERDVIQLKYKEPNSQKKSIALGAGACGLMPLPGVNAALDVCIFVSTTIAYLSAFGLSQEKTNSLEKLRGLKKARWRKTCFNS